MQILLGEFLADLLCIHKIIILFFHDFDWSAEKIRCVTCDSINFENQYMYFINEILLF